MRVGKAILSLIFFGVLFGNAAANSARAEISRADYAFNGGWLMQTGDVAGADRADFDDGRWQHVTLPRAFNENDAFHLDIHKLPTGIVWYRKHFVLPPTPAGGKVLLEFEGARHAAEVYINGRFAARSENGVMAFGVDATAYIRPAPEENVIAVRVDNDWKYQEKATGTSFQWSDMNFYANYGGINKNVRLHLTGPLYQTLPLYSSLGTTGVYIWADQFDIGGGAATIHAESQVRNDSSVARSFVYRVSLRDAAGHPAGQIDGNTISLAPGETRIVSASARLTHLHFWSWGYGYLYDVKTSLVVDGHEVDSVTTRTGFRKTSFANGAVALNDRVLQIHGYAQRTTNEWPALGIDVPPWLSDFSNAMMVQGGANLVRWMHVTPSRQDAASADRVGLMQSMPAGDSEGDASGRQWEQRVELMRDSIIYNRNRPSIIFYECGNKGITEDHMAQMRAVRDEFDPHGGRAIGGREMLGSKVAEYGGEMLYIDKSAGKPVWAHEYSRDEGARKFQDEFTPPFHKDSPDYNRNQDSHAVEEVRRWYDYWRERPGSGKRVNAGGVNLVFSDSNTHFRGDNNYRRSGAVDPIRLPKEVYFAHQVMWDGWVNVEHPRTHIIGHWNYAPGTIKDVQVVSSAQRVQLFLNGHSLGYGERNYDFLFTFKQVAWAPGVLMAVGYDAKEHKESSYELRTAGAPAMLRLTAHVAPHGWRADGADVALVDVEVVDAKGRRVPTALDMIHFSFSGPAEWRGGIAQGPDNYILAKDLPVEGGINRIILRSTTKAGNVRVTAHADGLRDAVLDLHVTAPPAQDGKSPLEGDDLAPRLDRGPTPKGPSFVAWRTPIPVASAIAGSNAQDAGLSFDDNETTAWTSDGDLSHAWIEYSFDHPRTVGELTLRVPGFRMRVYPVRITLDGQTVFEGDIPNSFGYVTLPLGSHTGSHLRIALTGPTADRDPRGKVMQITDEKTSWGTRAEFVKSGDILSILEAEIYEARPGTQ
jgi:hypothetical protein